MIRLEMTAKGMITMQIAEPDPEAIAMMALATERCCRVSREFPLFSHSKYTPISDPIWESSEPVSYQQRIQLIWFDIYIDFD